MFFLNIFISFHLSLYGPEVKPWFLEQEVRGTNTSADFLKFFIRISSNAHFGIFSICTEMADPILKMA